MGEVGGWVSFVSGRVPWVGEFGGWVSSVGGWAVGEFGGCGGLH